MLKYQCKQACLVFLAVAALAAVAQTPPAKKSPKPGEPVFADFVTPTQAAPAAGAAQKAVVGSQTTEPKVTAPQAGQPQASGKPDDRGQKAEVSPGTNVTASTPTNLSGYVPDDKYKLRVGDKISLQILEDRDLPKGLVVADSGELDVPYIGRVAASDKTCKQLADELKVRLEKEYYHRATVIIALDVANKLLGRIYVWGQVRSQGPIDITVNENLTAGKAILRAGGFGDFANKKRVKVVRGGGTEGGAKQSFELNMVDILEKGKTERDVVLQPDDFIIVPSRLINF
jgi:protein involved in polysaccharide export with SLBB domain